MGYTKESESAKINIFEVFSNKDTRSCDVKSGTVELRYYESIFEHSVKVTAQIIDTGSDIVGDDNALVEFIDGLKVGGGEKINLSIEDNFGAS